MNLEEDDSNVYCVVVNREGQHSIWPVWKRIPAGWRATGKCGSKQTCLDHIDRVWTDLRPLRLRRAMERSAKRRGDVQG